MLNKKESKKRNLWKYGIVMPVLTVFMLQFQVNVVAQEKAIAPKSKVTTSAISADIPPNITDEELNLGIKALAAEYGITIKFSGIKRDQNGNIIYLAAVAKDKKGKTQKYAAVGTDGDMIAPFRFYIKNPEQENITFGFENVSELRTAVKEVVPEDSYYLDKNKDTVAVAAKTIPDNATKSENSFSTTFNDESDKYLHTYSFGPYTKTTTTDGKEVTEKKSFLILINGKEYLSSELQDYKISTPGTFKVLTKEEAKAYGEKGKDGVIVFTGNSVTITKEKSSPASRVVSTKDGDIVFYDNNKIKVPGKAPLVFSENEPELIVDGVKQSNPEAAMKKMDVMKIENIAVNTKPDGMRQVIIKTK